VDIIGLISSVRLSRLDISNNFISGTIHASVLFLPTLRSIDLSDNLFQDKFPSGGGWSSIESLEAANNLFTGTISSNWPQKLSKLICLCSCFKSTHSEMISTNICSAAHFDMSGNLMNGTIPTDLCNFPNLEQLLLSSNDLVGTIPSCIANLDRLRVMRIADAGLNGPIPDGIDHLKELTILDFSNNTLTGRLPSSLNRLTLLNGLHVNVNVLSGSLPSDLGRLTFLRKLHLANNAFVGSIPSAYTALTNLESLTTAGNALTGSVPEGLCQLTAIDLTAAEIGCDVECPCCKDDSETCG
jgi:Leucine-rich repeat (LRR) protein